MANEQNLTPFQPGQSGNPNGRPPGIPNSRTRLKRLLELTEKMENPVTKQEEDFTVAEQIDLAQIVKARRGDTRAYNSLLDRLEGKPVQDLNANISGGLNVALVKFIGDDNEHNDDDTSTEAV